MMNLIRSIFVLNQPILLFGYGLTFFVMGLAIAFQLRSNSRLQLARSLVWLAAFGIFHSLYIWAELFSPVQEAYLSLNGIIILHRIHLVFLGISLLCLFEFGESLLQPLKKGRAVHPLSLALLTAYILIALVVLPRIEPNPHIWHNTANALARYLIGFPGSVLAAYGLRDQTFRHIAPLHAPQIVSTLRTAGIALALFAFFGGLLPPPVPFFPGNVLNSDSFERLIGIPSLVFQAVIGLVLAVTIIRALDIFNVEIQGRIEEMEKQQILTAERDRIARDLHDGSIQMVYTAGLLVNSARKLIEPDSPAVTRLDKAVEVLNDAIHDLRRNLVELRGTPSKENLLFALQQIADDPRFHSLVQVTLDVTLPEGDLLSPLRTDHVMAIVKEAMSNIVRHANARHALIRAQAADGHLHMSIQDDGSGFPADRQPGFGLRNMQDRARLLGGKLDVKSDAGQGTTVLLDIPWKDEAV